MTSPNGNGRHSPNGNGKGNPSSNGRNGKDPKTGKFLPGNKLGTGGDPWAAQKSKFRSVLANALTPQEMGKIAKALIRAAKRGESWAVKEVLDRMLGKPQQDVNLKGHVTVAELIASLRPERDAVGP